MVSVDAKTNILSVTLRFFVGTTRVLMAGADAAADHAGHNSVAHTSDRRSASDANEP